MSKMKWFKGLFGASEDPHRRYDGGNDNEPYRLPNLFEVSQDTRGCCPAVLKLKTAIKSFRIRMSSDFSNLVSCQLVIAC